MISQMDRNCINRDHILREIRLHDASLKEGDVQMVVPIELASS